MASQVTAIGDTVEFAGPDAAGHVGYWNYPLGGSMSSETVIDTSVINPDVAIATDSKADIVVIYGSTATGPQTLYYKVSSGSATSPSFGGAQTLSSITSMNQFSLNADVLVNTNVAALVETEGTASPYNVRFDSFPPIVPVASTSPNSWSRPGLSPYESYFQQLTEYVSPGNGLLSIAQDDLVLPGRGMNLVIGRVFSTPYGFRSNSPFEYDNFTLANLGNGWALNLPWLGLNYLHLTDGQAYPYQWSGSTFQMNGATNFKLVQNGDNTYDLFFASGTDYHYASDKTLLSITDRTSNNVISFTYSAGHISQATDTIGRTVAFSYNANSQLSSISSGGKTWTYRYSGSNLINVTDPLSRVTRYEYNNGNNRWLVTKITYPTSGWTAYGYGSAMVGTDVVTNYITSRNVYWSASLNSLTQSISTSYKIADGLITWANATMADGMANIQGYLFTNFQNSKSLTKVYDKGPTGALVRITESDYDIAGRTNQTKIISPTNTVLASSQTTYDNWGNPVYTSDNVGHKTYFSYANTNSQNTFGTTGFSSSFYTPVGIPSTSNIHNAIVGVASLQDGTGTAAMESYFKYDALGNVLELKKLHSGSWLLTDYACDTWGNRVSVTDALSHTTYLHYSTTYSHAYLTLTSILVNSVNITTSRGYDLSTGNLLSATDPNGYVTSYGYDSLNRLSSITYPAIAGVSAQKFYGYDDTNNILTLTDPNGNVVKQNYDGLGRMVSLQRYNGSTLYSTESYTYNWLNLISSKTTGASSTYSYSYDQDGRPTTTTNPGPSTVTTAYDDVNSINAVTDENGHQKQYLYNWNGQLTSVREYYKAGAYNTTTYQYDLSGNLVKQTDPNGKVTTYQYDDLNRLTKTTYPDTTFETKTYDSVNNLGSRTDPKSNTINYAYDALNRLTTITYPDTSTVSYTYDKAGNRLTKTDTGSTGYYTYDAMNRVTNETDRVSAVSYQVLYTYDRASNILSVKYPDGSTESYSYDALNRVSNVNTGAVKFTYTVDDKLGTITYGNGVVSSYSYDARDRPTRILATSGGTKVLDLNYTYDGANNVMKINRENYTYDWLNRVSTSAGPWGTLAYNYDGAGNIASITQNSVKTTYGYGNYNRLSSVGSVTLGYDGNGNMNQKVNGTNTWVYSYDYENRLTSVTKNNVILQTNTYSSDGQRVKKVEGQVTTVYVYEGANSIFQKNVGSGMVDKYYYANGLLLEEACECGYFYYYLNDALGSVRVVMQGSSNTLFSSNYKPFGLSYQQRGASLFQYGGKPIDTSTALYYLGGRFYDPAIQRFVTEDSQPGYTTDPQSLNRYAYARDNPLTKTDQTGHDWLSSITHAVANTAKAVGSALSSIASPVTNWYDSQPPQTQAVIVVVAVAAIAVATGGLGLVAAGAVVGSAGLSLTVTSGALVFGAIAMPGIVIGAGATVNALAYTLSGGRRATPEGALNAAWNGAVAGAETAKNALELGKNVIQGSKDSNVFDQSNPGPQPPFSGGVYGTPQSSTTSSSDDSVPQIFLNIVQPISYSNPNLPTLSRSGHFVE
jgi:RHS repeat-associated protein